MAVKKRKTSQFNRCVKACMHSKRKSAARNRSAFGACAKSCARKGGVKRRRKKR